MLCGCDHPVPVERRRDNRGLNPNTLRDASGQKLDCLVEDTGLAEAIINV